MEGSSRQATTPNEASQARHQTAERTSGPRPPSHQVRPPHASPAGREQATRDHATTRQLTYVIYPPFFTHEGSSP
jgi:hypothetical protein